MAEQLAGIDISNHQNTAARNLGRPIDWEAVARSGVAFCWVKATEDGGQRLYRDPYLQANVDGARAAGIAPGAYHFARPGDARLQARQFVEYAGGAGAFGEDALRAMLDVEDAGVGDDWITAWIDEFRAVTGIRRVIVYANRAFFKTRLHPERWADEDVLLWLADYDGSTDRLQWNHPKLAVKQYSETGAVAGFPTRIDVNVTVNGYGLDALLIGGDMANSEDILKKLDEIQGYLWKGGKYVDSENPLANEGISPLSVFGRTVDMHEALKDVWELTGKNIGQVLAGLAQRPDVTLTPEQVQEISDNLENSALPKAFVNELRRAIGAPTAETKETV